MGLIQKFKSSVANFVIKNTSVVDGEWFGQYWGGGVVHYDKHPKTYIDKGFNSNIVVRNCVQFIYSKGSDIPWKLVKQNLKGEEEEVDNHWAIDLLENPNPHQDKKEFIEQGLASYMVTGDAYIHKLAPVAGRNKGKPKELWNLPTPYMEIEASAGVNGLITGYKLNYLTITTFSPDEIIHIKTPSLDWDDRQNLYGVSPLRAGMTTLNLSNSTAEARLKKTQNSGAEGLLMYNQEKNSGLEIDSTQLKGVKDKLESNVNGLHNKGRITATSKMFDYLQLGSSAQDLQLDINHSSSMRDLCALFNLNSVLFNDQSASTESNVQQARKSAYTDAIIPRIENYVSKINKDILQAAGEDVYFVLDYSEIPELQEDKTELIKALSGADYLSTPFKQEASGQEPDGKLSDYYLNPTKVPYDQPVMDDEARSEMADEADRRFEDEENENE